jgi:8-oxo-dGTP pyrophosphatase MutT (NUDIX family)
MRQISAGVVVVRINAAGTKEVLLQFKRKYNEWEFPGGKLNGTETAKECAKRELWEETGIDSVNLEQLFYIDHRDAFGCVMFLVYNRGIIPRLREPDKHSAIGWFGIDALPTPLTKDTEASIDKGCLQGL